LEKKGKRKRERGNDKPKINFAFKIFDNMNGTRLQINNNGENIWQLYVCAQFHP
jgi:hypothetical protein